jgi:hypothetical protein
LPRPKLKRQIYEDTPQLGRAFKRIPGNRARQARQNKHLQLTPMPEPKPRSPQAGRLPKNPIAAPATLAVVGKVAATTGLIGAL